MLLASLLLLSKLRRTILNCAYLLIYFAFFYSLRSRFVFVQLTVYYNLIPFFLKMILRHACFAWGAVSHICDIILGFVTELDGVAGIINRMQIIRRYSNVTEFTGSLGLQWNIASKRLTCIS